ncbi:MAG: amino acid adenylation domain-containing protein [Flammeovirgaceae bacterium]
MWEEVLEIKAEAISTTQSFFDLGGNSLKGVFLVNKIQQAFGVELPLQTVFNTPTIVALVEAIGTTKRSEIEAITKVEERPYYPVASSQKRLYFLYEFDKEATTYNMPLALKLEGKLDLEKCHQAFQILVHSHEVLRTSFDLVDGEPVQLIHPEPQAAIEQFAIDAADETGIQQIIQNFIRPFDLKQAPLIRVGLIQLENAAVPSHILLLDLHHIITDGVTQNILTKEFINIYHGEALPKLEIQYKDFAVWQQSEAQQERIQAQSKFWLDRFQGDIPYLTLPYDFPRPSIQSHQGTTYQFALDEQLSTDLNQLCKAQNVSLYMLLLAIYQIMLSKLSQQEDIIVGTSTAGRRHASMENMMGIFTNVLALRNFPKPEKSFVDFLAEVRESTITTFDHQDFLFEDLVEQLQLKRNTSRNPLFDVMFDLQNIEEEMLTLPNLKVSPYAHERTTARFDLTFTAREVANQIDFTVEYATELFTEASIAQFGNYFQYIAQQVVEDAAQRLGNIQLLKGDIQQDLIQKFDFQQKAWGAGASIQGLVEQAALANPQHIACHMGTQILTYQQLNEQANQLAHFLKENFQLQANDVVAILLERSPEAVIALLGTLKAGAAFLPIDRQYPANRIQYILNDAQVKGAIIHSEMLFDMEFPTPNIFAIDIQLETLEDSTENLNVVSTGEDSAYVIYTSGSTGNPKGVVVSQQNACNYLLWANQYYFGGNSGFHFPLFTSLAFDLTLTSVFTTLLRGDQIHIFNEQQDMSKTLRQIMEPDSTINAVKLTPSHVRMIQELNIEKSNVSHVILGGEKLQAHHIQTLQALNAKLEIFNEYGPTETTVGCTVNQVSDAHDLSIGHPIDGAVAYVFNEQVQPQAFGVWGELYIGGIGVSKGYLNNEALTAERFIQNPITQTGKVYKTGDIARWLPNGTLEYLGRSDDQVKLRGYRIELAEVETSLLSHPDIKEAVALVKELADDQALCAYFTAEKEVDAQTIRTHLQQRIPEYMIPNHFIQVEAFELTVNGKIDKAALPAWKSDSLEPSNYVPPRNEQEAQIAAIWQEVLKVAQVGITDDYFALGGDSLKAVRVIAQINDQLNLQLEVKDLFAYPTIEGLQQVIEEADYEQSTQAAWKRGMLEIDELKAKIIQEEGDKLPENYEDIYPFTPIETGMIYSSLLNPAEPIYNDQFIYPIEIANQELFMSSLKKLLVRHPILRTLYYRSSFSEPIKVVVETLENPLQTSDLRGQAQADQISVIKNYLQNDLAERISFNGELLWHVHLFQLAETSYVLVWTVHHAVLDGWSVSTFNTELSQLIANESLELPALRHTYKDYCAITLGKKTSENVQDFWKTTLADYTRNKLPFNYAGKQKRNSTGSRMIRKPIDPAVLPKLEAIASEHHISLKSICLAAHVYLMHLICSETDVVTGVVSHDRPAIQDADKILGCFLNTVPVRIQVEHVTNSLTLIKEVNQYLIKAKVNEIHLGDIAAAIGERTSKENPIFDCLLNFTDFHIHEQAKITNELYHNEALLATAEAIEGGEMTNTWFDLEVDKTFDVLSVKIKYLPAYFEDEEMHYALELYMRILKHFAAGVEQALNPSVLLNEEERNELLYQFNDTILPYSKEATLHQLFENQAEKTPNHPALRCKGEELSYQELNKKSNALARFLLNHGVKNDDNVALIASRDFNMIIGMFAILKAGAAYVPIDPDYPLDRQSYIIENSNVNLALLDAEYEISQSNQVKCILIKEEAYQHLDSNNLNLEKDTTELAYTIYTSGSTGRPKGVMIEHHSAVNLVEWVNKEFKVNADDRLLFITSMCFDLSVYDIFGILAAGGTVVMASKEDVQMVDKLKTLLKNENITFWDSVPTTMNYLISELEMTDPTYQQHDLRLVFMSGDWIPVNLPDRIKNHFPNAQPISLGGATEGTVWSNYFPIHEVGELWPSIPYGKPIDNNFFYILDKDQHPVPKGVVGELYIGGVGVARGYANDSEKTNRAFVDDPFNDKLGGRMYRTGDLGRMLPNNQMEFLGRKDHQVKIRGFRIELGEIESCLEKYPSISQAVVLAKGEKTDKYLCAYFTSSEKVSPATLRSHILESLPDYMVPGYFVHLDKFPVNTNGKVDRKQLPAVDQAAVSEETYVAPSNPIEAKIIALWQDLLNIQGIGASDNFFELGGHSLTAVRLVDQLKRAFGVNLPIAALFQAPIVTQLAQVIQQAMHQESKTQLLVPLKPTGSKTPIFLVPPIMGTALSYANLVKHISDDQPVYGLQTSGLEAGQEIHTTMEDMAACYIAEIKKMQAAGPYILAGWSFGGLIAFEMAQQLKATGDQVQKLVLFDTNSEMESANKTDLAHELSFLESGIMLSHLEDAQKEALWTKIQQEYPQITTEEARLSYLMEQHQTAAIFDFPEFNQALLARLLRVWKAHSIAGANYQAQVFEGHSVLFRASELINDDASETRGWDKLLSGEFSTLKVGGSHATMLQDPHAAGLAQQLEKAVTDLIDIAGV